MCIVYANVLKGILYLSTYDCTNSQEFSGGECNRVRILHSFNIVLL